MSNRGLRTSMNNSKSEKGRSVVRLIFFTSLLSNSFAFNGQLSAGSTQKAARNVASPIRLLPSYGKRRRQRPHNPLQTSVAFPAGDPSLDLNKPSPAAWDEVIGSEHPLIGNDGSIASSDKAIIAGSILFVISSFGLLAMTSVGCWRYFLAGGVCAAISHAIPTPIDVIKTRKQVDPELADVNILHAARRIAKKEGMSSLWAGLGPTVWGYLLEGAIKFGVYEVLKPIVKRSLSKVAAFTSYAIFNSQLLAYTLSGIASGLAASLMICPMEALRIRMVAEPDFAPNGSLEGGLKILRREGVSGLVKGINPMIMKQVPYTVTKNVSFDIITRFFYSMLRAQSMAITVTTSFVIPLVSAAIASVLSSITSQPGDMVLSLINAHEGDQRSRDILRNIVRSERGMKGLFVGFKTRLLHVGIIVTVQLLIYDYVKRLCGIAATGSV